MGGSSSKSKTATTNEDNRVANSGGLVLTGSTANGSTINVNSPDAVKAIAQLSAETLKATGGAVVDLTAFSIERNLTSLDNTVNKATALTDSLISKSYENSDRSIKAANATAASAIKSANEQVKNANTSASKVTTDAIASANALVRQQQDDVKKLAEKNTTLAFGLATDAVKAFQPGDNKASDNITKLGIAAAVAVGAFAVFRK